MKKTGAGFNRGSSKQDYATPPDFMSAVEKRFGLVAFDLAASANNSKHANYFSESDNSLVQEWHKIPGNLWLNPPFDPITPWAQKCASESILGATIFFLVPASV
jgi:phage N-6-adenine-methyltransferase